MAIKDSNYIYDEFIAVDLETTGLSSTKNRIIEIGAVKVKKGVIVEEFRSFVNPEISIPYQITRITGITDSMVMDAPIIDNVLPSFLNFAGSIPLVAHNASFDLGFIRHNANLLGISVINPVICTLKLSRQIFANLDNYKLDTVSRYAGVKLKNHHRAIDDSRAAAHIYLKCMDVLNGKAM